MAVIDYPPVGSDLAISVDGYSDFGWYTARNPVTGKEALLLCNECLTATRKIPLVPVTDVSSAEDPDDRHCSDCGVMVLPGFCKVCNPVEWWLDSRRSAAQLSAWEAQAEDAHPGDPKGKNEMFRRLYEEGIPPAYRLPWPEYRDALDDRDDNPGE